MTESGAVVTPRRSRRTYVLIGAFAVLVIAGAALAGFLVSGTGQSAPATDRRAEAIRRCETAVKTQLKAPATAKFSGIREGHDGGEPDANPSYRQWELSGSVDAENSYGALLRSSWTCTVAYDSSSGTWADAYASVTSSE